MEDHELYRDEFEWNAQKAAANESKHGVSFAEASTVFRDTLSVTVEDSIHSDAEERLVIVGLSTRWRVLIVVHVERGDRIRIISARPANRRERRWYEEEKAAEEAGEDQ